jgi:hypothetical protein
MEVPYLDRYIMVIVTWSYVPTGRAISRNVPSEARRILMGHVATGPKHYPWILEGSETMLAPYAYALIKPKEHQEGRGRVGAAEGAIALFKVKEGSSKWALGQTIRRIGDFCDEWKSKGKYGMKITSYQIALSDLVVHK